MYVNIATFNKMYPFITLTGNETEKKKEMVQYIMFMDEYVNAVVNAPKIEHEECRHTHVHVKQEQTRSIDEMETLTRYCLDCGFVNMQT